MSKERARRRAQRQADAEARRLAAEKRERRRRALRRLRPSRENWLPDRRTGRLFARRSRSQRAGIALAGLCGLALIWLLVDSMAYRIALTAVLVVAAPALVVLTLGRRL